MARCWLLPLACLAASLLPAALATRGREVCECNGMSRQCIFDWQLLRDTGNGYRCLGCQGNTEGTRCEHCKEGFFRQQGEQCCLPCHCHPWGALSPQCDSNGQCSCKPGVAGDKCDRCQLGFESLSEAGCQRSGQSLQCECDPAGSTGDCHSGRCVCKESVTGERCHRCKQHFYNLDVTNPAGCSPCFCYGHSVTCVSADNHSIHNVTSAFQQGAEGWRGVHKSGSPAQLQWSPHHQNAFIVARSEEPIYFVAPAKFLGNQQLSYGQMLSFNYRLDRGGQQPSAHDVVLEGHGLRVTAPFLPQGKVLPCGTSQTYTFRLDEHPSSKWSPRLNLFEFRRLLGNLTAIWIRATFGEYSTGYIDNVTLVSAQPVPGVPAPWVERCQCPAAYEGQFCESCAPGYRRDGPGQGPFGICVPCNCQGGGICDPDTGECYSGDEHVGSGISCPLGFYRDPRQPHGCRRCPCGPGQGCSMRPDSDQVVCDHCPPGAAGASCEYCADGYFGGPAASQPCQLCRCNGNVEPNAVGNCDRRTGECLKCIHNTAGFYCDRCKDGFFGNPLAPDPAQKCRACACNSVGAEPLKCRSDGSCICKPGFEGPRCEEHECPACYGQVKGQVELYLQQLSELELLLSEARAGRGAESQKVEERMQEAEETLRSILREALSLQASDRSLEGHVARMKGQGSSSQSRLDEIKATVERLMSLGIRYERQVQETRQLLERARLDLDRSGAALRGVTIPVSSFPGGSNQFLLLAQEALRLANSQTQAANAIEQAARAARDHAGQALELLRAAATGDATSGSLPGLLSRYKEIQSLAGGLKADANGMASKADKAYQGSLMLLSSLSRLTETDIGSFKEKASQLEQDSSALLGLVDTSTGQFRGLQSRVGRWEEEAKELLRGREGDRAKLTQLLSRAILARSTALQAMSSGNATFHEVEQILRSLKEFHLQTGDKRREAADAMRRLPIISSMVTRTRERTERAQGILGSTNSESKVAGSAAGEAKEIATSIQEEIVRLKVEANKTADGVLALEKVVAALQQEAKAVDDEFERKLSEVEADAAVIQKTAQEAQRAHDKAGQAGVAMQGTLSALEELLRLMTDQPGTVDEDGLRQLEANFSRAQSRSKQLKAEMSELEQMAALQRAQQHKLESSIDDIMADIKNLEDIQRSLPPGCYNTKAIELP